MYTKFYFVLYLLFMIFIFSNAGRFSHDETLSPGEVWKLRIGMINKDDASSHSSPGNGQSYINIGAKFKTSSGTGNITILRYYYTKESNIGYLSEDGRTRHMCCTQELKDQGSDCEVGSVYTTTPIPNSGSYHEEILQLTSEPTHTIGLESPFFNVTKSGIYYVYFLNCNETNTGDVIVTGTTSFMNPYGHLSADSYPFMPFYGILALFYLVLSLVWFSLSARHWDKLLVLQYCIAGVIALGMMECTCWYFELLVYNITGQPHDNATTIAVLTSSLKRTVSRVLVLVVAMGYGVVKPTLGSVRYKILCLAGLYFLFSAALSRSEALDKTDTGKATQLLLVFPVAVLDTAFYWWIFLSLFKTMGQLSIRNQHLKLDMYKKLNITLMVSGVASALLVILQMFIMALYTVDQEWRTWWTWSAVWQILYFVILLVIAILWRPTTNNTRYAYATGSGYDSDEGIRGIELRTLHVTSPNVGYKKRDEEDIDEEGIDLDELEAQIQEELEYSLLRDSDEDLVELSKLE